MKANYESRPNYSIENAILEKRLVYDNSFLIERKMIHNMIDLQSYYNHKFAKIGLIA